MEPRLTTEFWVQAYFTRLGLANLAAYVIQKGDLTAGAVLVKQAKLDGTAVLFQRETGMDGKRAWAVMIDGPEADVDASIKRQIGFDPDIWVLEVEDRTGNCLLDQDGLSD